MENLPQSLENFWSNGHQKKMAKCARHLNSIIEGVILALVIFTPLAFGSVHIWAYTKTLSLNRCSVVLLWLGSYMGIHHY